MSISCASVLLLNPSDPAPIDTAEIVRSTESEAKRGAPLELLAPMLEAAAIIVAFNNQFDLTVTAGHDEALRGVVAKLSDPMVYLERFTGRRNRLAQVLAANVFEARGSG